MTAILRYAFLKSSRDKLLIGLVLSPAVLLASPLLGVGVLALLKGRGQWPLSIDPNVDAALTGRIMAHVAAVLAAGAASVGAFRVFAQEIANRTVGFFVLAASPETVVLASTLYGSLVGIAAFVLEITVLSILTGGAPSSVVQAATAAVVASVIGSALGVAMVSLSSEHTMLIPIYAAFLALATLLFDAPASWVMPAAVASFLVIVPAAFLLMRRRCAI